MMFSTGLAEVVFVVKDVQTAARFYREIVGLIPQSEADDEWAWFWVGEPGRDQRLALHTGTLLFEEHSPLPEGQRFGTIHYALHVPAPRLGQAVEQVKSKGVPIYGPIDFTWRHARSYYFYDPDGNLLEFWSPEATSPQERE
jgi:catechol 2,3-dioxygenase-like lactoylglutathione lyase family enzyme